MTYKLCVCCVHKDGCTYRRGRRQVFRCEEFEGIKPDTARQGGRGRRGKASAGITRGTGSGADARTPEHAGSIQASE